MPDAGTRGMCSLLRGLAIVGGELFGSPTMVRWLGEVGLSLRCSQPIAPCMLLPFVIESSRGAYEECKSKSLIP